MRRWLAVALLTVSVSFVAPPAPAQNAGSPASTSASRAWRPDDALLSRPCPLPEASLTEPFAIGEALYDPGRVEAAVVSLVSALGIPIVPDNPKGIINIGRTMQLTQSEVRALIAMGRADAAAQAQDPGGPYTFTDFHKELASSLPDMSVEELAEAYAMEYEQNPNRLAPQVLMGQPIEPDMPLMRTQMWLLLVDGLMAQGTPRAAARRGPRIVFARAAQEAVWTGTGGLLNRAGLESPDQQQFADAAWSQLVVRIPLAMASAIKLIPSGSVHEGHGGPGQPVTITAQFTPPTITFDGGLGTMNLVPQQSSLSGSLASWAASTTVRRHTNAPEQTPLAEVSGAARLTVTPRAEASRGRGVLNKEPGSVRLTVILRSLVRRTYGLTGLSFPLEDLGEATAEATLNMEWHAADTLEINIANDYDVGSGRVGLTRSGTDSAIGTLALEPDRSYRGVVRLAMRSKIAMPGKTCSPDDVLAAQYAEVVAVPIAETATSVPVAPVEGPGQQYPPGQGPQTFTPAQRAAGFYTAVRTRQGYTFTSGTPTRYYRLEFTPASAPQYFKLMQPDPAREPVVLAMAKDECMDEIPACETSAFCGAPNFIPLNDAQWTIKGYGSVGAGEQLTINVAGYPIAAPEAKTPRQPERLEYIENREPENRELLGAFGLGSLVKADSKWTVTVIHTKEN